MAIPLEIRHQIYRLAAGSMLVHIGYHDPAETGLSLAAYYTCRASRSEKKNYEEFMSSKTLNESLRGQNDHYLCTGTRPRLVPFDIPLFRVNRQIYEEARSIATQTTTLSFKDCPLIKSFVRNLPRAQHSQVRKLRLEMTMVTASEEATWTQTIVNFILPHLTNIRHLYICLDVGSALCWTQRYDDEKTVEELDWMQPVLALGQLPLESATVVIDDGSYHGTSQCHRKYCLGVDAHRSGVQQPYRHRRMVKQNHAEYLRKKLLGID